MYYIKLKSKVKKIIPCDILHLENIPNLLESKAHFLSKIECNKLGAVQLDTKTTMHENKICVEYVGIFLKYRDCLSAQLFTLLEPFGNKIVFT